MSIYMWRDVPDYFYMSSVGKFKIGKNGTPTEVNIEISTDKENRSAYTIGERITPNSSTEKIYFRNTSTTTTGFSTSGSNYYQLSPYNSSQALFSGGDITTLLNKNGTDTLSDFCFIYFFKNCTYLYTPPKLLATNLANRCYVNMFYGCTYLNTLPQLPATALADYCYGTMFYKCSYIKLSTTQTGDYQTEYRIPTTGTGTLGNNSLSDMFTYTGGTFKGTPTINTTYYTSNTVV